MPPYTNSANHCFALNGDIYNPEVDGLDEVINVYKHAINAVNLYGPTHFAQILELINDKAEADNCSQAN